jgi:hypothetical protein
MAPPKIYNKGHSWHVCFVGFIVEAIQGEAPEAVAHKPVVGKTHQHKVHTYYKLMLDKGIKYLICTQIAERCISQKQH